MVTLFFLIAGVFLSIVCLYLIFAYCYLLVMLRKNRNAIVSFDKEFKVIMIRVIQKNTQFQKSRSAIKKKELKLFIMSSITGKARFWILDAIMVPWRDNGRLARF